MKEKMKIGIDIGGSHISIGVVNNKGQIEDKIQMRITKTEKRNIKKVITEFIINNVNEITKKYNILEIGIALPGMSKDGVIITSGNLKIKNYPLAEKLQEKIKMPIYMKNDAKAAAMAEKEYGSLKKYKDCIFLCIGTGIGGASFLGGKLLEPSGFSGFEFGHMVIEKDGRPCTCGKKGCFEQYASISAVKKRVTSILNEDPNVTGRYLRENLLIKDNPLVKSEIESWLNYLKIGVGNLIDIFEPEAICFGGSFSHYEGNPILYRLIEKLKEPDTTFTTSEKPDIVLAKYKNDAGIIGATID